MKQVIGFTFLLASPIFLGAFIVMAVGGVLGFTPAEFMPVAFSVYTVVWILAYASWFEGSDYQKTL